MDIKTQSIIINKIKREFITWVPRFNTMNNNKLARGKYMCEKCKHIGPQKDMQVDHKDPVIPITGFIDWNHFIPQLFCMESNLQLLCKSCHKEKSTAENKLRREHKKKLTDNTK